MNVLLWIAMSILGDIHGQVWLAVAAVYGVIAWLIESRRSDFGQFWDSYASTGRHGWAAWPLWRVVLGHVAQSLTVSFVAVMIAWLAGYTITATFFSHKEPGGASEQKLVALRDPTGVYVNGTFFLGSGVISSTGRQYYAYYTQDGDAFQAQVLDGQCRYSNTYCPIFVYEDNASGGLLRTSFQRTVTNDEVPTFWQNASAWEVVRYEFHVPPGSIRREIRLGG